MGLMLDSNGTPTFDWTNLDALDDYLKGEQQMSNGKLHMDVPAIPEPGYNLADDLLPIDNLLADVQEVAAFVRQARYKVDNLAHVIGERQAINVTAADLLVNSTKDLQVLEQVLRKIAGGK